MKKYLVLTLFVLSLALLGCPKSEPAPADPPDAGTTDNAGVKGEGAETPK